MLRTRTVLATIMMALLLPAAPASATTAGSPAVPPAHTRATERGWSGTVRTPDCSGAVVRWPSSRPTDDAVVLMNGHCFRLMGRHDVYADRASDQQMQMLAADGSVARRIRADRLDYATMSRTDVAVYHLPITYRRLESRDGVEAYTVKAHRAAPRGMTTIPSGYWRETYTCHRLGFAYRLHEQTWSWHDSLRYRGDRCKTKGGTSGAPVLNGRGQVIGVNNTGYVGGRACRDTVCEIRRDGTRRVYPHRDYGQQTWWLVTCLDADRRIDPAVEGCRLPKPAA